MSPAAGDRRVCGTLLHLDTRLADLTYGAFRIETFLDLPSHSRVLALCHGDPRGDAPLLARVHSSCMTSEASAVAITTAPGQLDAALEAVARRARRRVPPLAGRTRRGFVAEARDRYDGAGEP
jgi:GTP cyclohydrolase II